MDIKKVKQVVPFIWKAGLTPLLIGAHGTGKTSVATQLAQELGYDGVVSVRLGQMSDAGDLTGLPTHDLDAVGRAIATRFIPPSKFPTNGKYIVFLDEINRCHKDLIQAIFQFVEKGHSFGDYTLPAGSVVLAASNPPTDEYTVLDFKDAAFADRFVHLKFEPSQEEFFDYAKVKGFHDSVISFFQKHPQHLENRVDFSIDYVTPSRRSAEYLDEVLHRHQLPKEYWFEVAAGMLGPKVASLYLQFYENNYKVIDPLDVLDNLSKYKTRIPTLTAAEVGKLSDDIHTIYKDKEETASADYGDKCAEYAQILKPEARDTFVRFFLQEKYLLNEKFCESFFPNEGLMNMFVKAIEEKEAATKTGNTK